LEAEIFEIAGERFTIGSPKQLGDILFGKMGLPGGSKTKTGQWSTSASVLEDLAAEGHPPPRKIVDWRQLTKLKSTYTDALPGYVNPETHRVHTSYALASTTTGRLSSSEPNLQNIPIRTAEGRKIRTAFIADKGHKLMSADYSQIELRVLAHVADIPQLRQAFADGRDIHAATASEMFNVPIEGMPSEMRRRAKAINFGIIYGISAFGLANQLGFRARRRRSISRNILNASRASGSTSTPPRSSPARTVTWKPFSAAAYTIRKSVRRTLPSAPSTNVLRPMRACKAQPPTLFAAP
jgi:DNA polymerase-1